MGANSKLTTGLFPALVGCVLAATGCGDAGPRRYQVSGTVTYRDQPVPRGFITFEPDDSRGNQGPGGGSPIVNGKYATAEGKGISGGPYRVKIVGSDGVPFTENGEQILEGSPLFPPYETTVDFPNESTEKDFIVPGKEE
jgi:hypothetical protein